MRILLVEAGYKNKYPPMGLMKISSYHKAQGDEVVFVKGKIKRVADQLWDRIYITSLFTFHFDVTVDTIRYYKASVESTNNIFVGGILATLMKSKLSESTGIENVIEGQLICSAMIGFQDSKNIDGLPLDYDILDDVDYKYPAGDNYFAYTTRGCPNECDFCAVSKLEPEFKTVNNIKTQIDYIDSNFGKKRNLLLLDNNVLESSELREIVDGIKDAGFYYGATYVYPNKFPLLLKKAVDNKENKKYQNKLKDYLYSSNKLIIHKKTKAEYELLLDDIYEQESPLDAISEKSEVINGLLEKYKDKREKLRFVDFNQGIDARRLTEERMAIISELPLRPLRIAFDKLAVREKYEAAIRLAHKYNVREMSNYILYNHDEKPFELWQRLKINIDLNTELGVRIFSFPMKYMPIDRTDRDFVGEHWCKKYLSAVTAILLVTKGVVAGGYSFFEKAFGRNEQEYYRVLSLPREFIVYRFKYENLRISEHWEDAFYALSVYERLWLLEYVGGSVYVEIPTDDISSNLKVALSFYTRIYDLQSFATSEKETMSKLVIKDEVGKTTQVFLDSISAGISIIKHLARIEKYHLEISGTPYKKTLKTIEVWDDEGGAWKSVVY